MTCFLKGCDIEIMALVYFEVDRYKIWNRCKRCGAQAEAAVRYPWFIEGRTGDWIKLPNIPEDLK